jgi:hypothetical protein
MLLSTPKALAANMPPMAAAAVMTFFSVPRSSSVLYWLVEQPVKVIKPPAIKRLNIFLFMQKSHLGCLY